MKIATFLWKNGDPAKRVVDFPREGDTYRNKIMEIVENFDEKSYNNNGKHWKSSRILRVKQHYFIFSLFTTVRHFPTYFTLPIFFTFFTLTFPHFPISRHFFHFPFFIFFQFFIFLHFLSFSLSFFLFFSFIFFHFLFLCWVLKI